MKLILATIALLAPGLSATAQVTCGISGVTVTVTPQFAAPGQVISVALTNNSGQDIHLPSSCTFQGVHAGAGCGGNAVFAPGCLAVITTVPTGTSSVMPWDQRDNSGQQVPDGVYSFAIHYYDSTWNQQSCCPTVTIASTPGTPYCFGDGTGTGCPCGNDNNGAEGGCDWGNPAFPEGGVLVASGSASMAANDLLLVATGISNNFGIFFGANNQVNGGNGNPLNDGLRCAGGGLVRLIPPTMAAGNQAVTPQPVQTLDLGAASGVTRRYQYWFRTPTGPCGQMANLTNGYEIVWLP